MLPRLPSKKILFSLGVLGCVVAALAADEIKPKRPAPPPTTPPPTTAPPTTAPSSATSPSSASSGNVSVDRGRYLVSITGCNDCHTPLTMGPHGPEPDMSRMLSG